MLGLFLFLPLRSFSNIFLMTESVPFSRDSAFSFFDSAGIFLPSAPFPLGARRTVDGRTQSIEEFRSLQIENSSTVFLFPNTKRFNLSYWRIPLNLCPAPSYLLNADFHITSRTSFYSSSDLCFFADPNGIGYFIIVTTQSTRRLTIQFYVNNSNRPHSECLSECPNCVVTCSSPFDQPFFLRIGGSANETLSLAIEYSIRYTEETKNGCFVSQIPTAVIAGEDSAVLQPQNYCVTLQQQTMKCAVKVGALAAVVVSIAMLCQHLGLWDFGGWVAIPRAVEAADLMRGTISVEFDLKNTTTPFLFESGSDSSSLSDPVDGPVFVR
jgi:hypothetical protein